MLHSVGCAQPSALVFANLWNKPNYQVAVHAAIQADGTVYQCLPWNYRGWHAGSTANNTHIGVEMTEPASLKYGNAGEFTCSDPEGAKTFVKQTYNQAVLLFAKLCRDWNLDPLKAGVIISHKEGHALGVASNHGDPEHLWTGLGLPFTMDTFRAAVKAEIEHQLAQEAAANQPAPKQPAEPVHEPTPTQPTDPGTGGTSTTPTSTLDNNPSAWAKEAVEWGKSLGIMTGDGNGNLMLHSPITREQFITVLYRLEQLKNK